MAPIILCISFPPRHRGIPPKGVAVFLGYERTIIMRHFLTLGLLTILIACGGSPSDDSEYVGRMADQHATDNPEANPMSSVGETAAVSGGDVVYGTVDGTELTGYMAMPEGAGDTLPGVLVIHEWWGLNDNIRSMTDRLAGEGYRALAVDLYDDQTADTPERARELMTAAMEQADRQFANLTAAHAFLVGDHQAPATGVMGWCFGGTWSFRSALALGDGLDAAVMYYGWPPSETDGLSALRAPVLGLFGEEDGGIPVASVRAFEAALEEVGAEAEIVIYPGAGHAFANPSGQNYQAEAAEDAWRRTVEFFRVHLLE
jgi:carboxymethylenebutenolidase